MPDRQVITHDAAILLMLLRDSSLERRVARLLEIVEAGTCFSIRELAARLHLSPGYLQRLFKKRTGICLGEWLSERRLQRAAYLLSNSFMSVKEITHAIGYEHTSSFVRAFERRFLQAPARFRKCNEGKLQQDTARRIRAA
jgi:AraC-like DNA-binding protein